MRQVVSNRLCSICKCTSADKWNIGQNLIKELGSSSSGTDIQPDDWVCEAPVLVYLCGQKLVAKNIINSRAEVLEHCLKIQDDDGACMIKNNIIMTTYKQMVESTHQCSVDTCEYESFKPIYKDETCFQILLFYIH